jgi:phosphate/sulfate permease
MENFYIILVVILFALAISDLIVGVSNDAVNFLNSAFGSNAAPKWVIFLMAGLGVFIGATFSDGMMEVARKGIFHPEMFYFSEIMVIFLAVMITDIILLDLFNTFGMPTSTTVSIVFELLGSAVAVSIVKIKSLGGSVLELSSYINSGKALAIITGILVSVVIAFTVGAIIQYITRLIFSFNYKTPMKYFGSTFGGLAITSIVYFILIKGISGSAFAEMEVAGGETLENWIKGNSGILLLYSFISCTILIQLLKWIFNIKILKTIVLIGTFALAMAFAGNDLVNFIGVPLAGFSSFKAWVAAGSASPETFSMGMLAGQVETPTYMLLISGLVMIATLIFSKKARSVVATSVDLSRQSEGSERFGSSLAARVVVRGGINFNKTLQKIMPAPVNELVQKRFVPVAVESKKNGEEAPAFDLIRASVNLVVASILIAFGTSLKLPLSTTYVTFMVAMGTSLADRAWDRESAVYRISGVFAVVGGWFLTAFIAFTISGIIAMIISIGGKFIIFVFVVVAIVMVLRTHILFKRRSNNIKSEEEDTINEEDGSDDMLVKSTKQVIRAIVNTNHIISLGIESFLEEDRNGLKKAENASNEFSKKAKKNKDKVYTTLSKLTEGPVDTSHFYVQMMDYKREMAHAVHYMLEPIILHNANNHKPFTKEQAKEMTTLISLTNNFFNYVLHTIKEKKFENIESLVADREKIFEFLGTIEKNQIKRIKNKEVNTRNSQLFFKINSEMKTLLLNMINLVKSYRDFVTISKIKK